MNIDEDIKEELKSEEANLASQEARVQRLETELGDLERAYEQASDTLFRILNRIHALKVALSAPEPFDPMNSGPDVIPEAP